MLTEMTVRQACQRTTDFGEKFSRLIAFDVRRAAFDERSWLTLRSAESYSVSQASAGIELVRLPALVRAEQDMKHVTLLVVELLMVLITAVPGVAVAGWIITDLGAQGATFNEVIAMNNRGEILGWAMAPDPFNPGSDRLSPFIWRPGSGMQELVINVPGTVLAVTDINDLGQVTGFSSVTADISGFIWSESDGSLQRLFGDIRNHQAAVAYAINNLGQAVGGRDEQILLDDNFSFTFTAVRWDIGPILTVNPIEVSTAWAINDAGQVIGSRAPANNENIHFYPPSPTNQFLWQVDTGAQPLSALCGTDFVVPTPGFLAGGHGLINNAGFILGNTSQGTALCDPGVGTYLVGFPGVAFNDINEVVGTDGGDVVLRSTFGTLLDLTELTNAASLGWTYMAPLDINDKRQILGYGSHNGVDTLFLIRRTVPEPATLAILGLAFAGMGWARRRKLN